MFTVIFEFKEYNIKNILRIHGIVCCYPTRFTIIYNYINEQLIISFYKYKYCTN